MFYGRIPVANAVSLLFFEKKGITQTLIHALKYKGNQEVGVFLGKWLAKELILLHWPKTIDEIIPVPLHKKRFKERGYNQVTGFGKVLAKELEADYNPHVLQKIIATRTQVFKSRLARAEIKDNYFSLKHPERLHGKHILLVDDLVTTGATLEACAKVFLSIPGIKISIATMAITA